MKFVPWSSLLIYISLCHRPNNNIRSMASAANISISIRVYTCIILIVSMCTSVCVKAWPFSTDLSALQEHVHWENNIWRYIKIDYSSDECMIIRLLFYSGLTPQLPEWCLWQLTPTKTLNHFNEVFTFFQLKYDQVSVNTIQSQWGEIVFLNLVWESFWYTVK